MKKLLFGLALLALPMTSATAQAMNAETFHKRVTALKKKGPFALFSRGEIRTLMGEAKAAGGKSGELRRAAIKAGRTPPYCPPAANQAMGSEEFISRLTAIPAAERAKINMTEALTRILASKYPCRS